MQIFSKHFINILLSGFLIFDSGFLYANESHPLYPIFTTSSKNIGKLAYKPKVNYKDSGPIINIKNMPPVYTQDLLGECRAFSLTTIIQKYHCDQRPDIKCTDLFKNGSISPEAISPFGTMSLTHQNPDKFRTFDPNSERQYDLTYILKTIKDRNGRLIPESCKSYSELVNNFTNNGIANDPAKTKKFNEFIQYLKDLYKRENIKSKTEAGIADCAECIENINKNAGLKLSVDNLREALEKADFEKFMYSIFFDNCETKSFSYDYEVIAFPEKTGKTTNIEIKNKILQGLKKGSSVLTPRMCLEWETPIKCVSGHSMVIAGYKKVCEIKDNTVCKDLFRIQNSWGQYWQDQNNDGWVDADNYIKNFQKIDGLFISNSVVWLENPAN